MLNYIWAVLIIIGVIYGALTGHMADVTNGALDSANDAVELCITMLGVMSLWTGLMEIATRSGIIEALTRRLLPVMHWLFPNVPDNHPAARLTPLMDFLFPSVPRLHPARKYIATNFVANFLGLGWAATPAGLMAMKSLSELNTEHPDSASDAMCAFLVINISSIQLIPVNIIAYRSQYGSANPAAIIGPAIIATSISTAAGIIFCKLACARKKGLG